ncbi:MAG: polysaccharide biosynthesis protein [Clostridiales bacterium]|nr:polysaccharide biosynthesis protein [Clostridiales bacterium]
MSKRQQTFMEGALVLMIAGLLVKVIGALFKLPLYNLVGPDAMAYFNIAYDIYVTMYIVTTAGLPVAVSRMVAESTARGQYANARRILQVAFTSFLVLGAAGCAVLFFGAGPIARLMGMPGADMAIRVIAPAILFEIVMSAYRGYYQGNQNMVPTAISQIIVAIAKLGGGFLAAYYVLRLGLPVEQSYSALAAAAISGVTLGTMLGSGYLVFRMLFFKPHAAEGLPESGKIDPFGLLLRQLVIITVPIAIGSMITSVSNLVDTAMINRRLLASGLDSEAARRLFGIYTGISRTMFNLPPALIGSIGIAVLPAISETFSCGRRAETAGLIASPLRLTILLALPAGMGFLAMAEPVLLLLYHSRAEDVAVAAPLLATLGIAVVFVCLVSITTSMLQAIGRERIPMATMLIGGVIKVLATYVLVGNPRIGLSGAPISTILCYLAITLLNCAALTREIKPFPNLPEMFARPLFCSVTACVLGRLIYGLLLGPLSGRSATLVAVAVTVLLYLLLVLVTKTLYKSDILSLPYGAFLVKPLEKRRWMR